MRGFAGFFVGAALLLVSLGGAATASATTFCVPGFSEACPDNGSNVAEPDLTDAMSTNGSDGNPDRVIVAPGTLTTAGSFSASGTDPLEVIGAGREETRLTSTATANIFLLLINNRPGTKMSDLTLVVPETFPDAGGNGSGAQIKDAELTRVNMELRNSNTDAYASMIGDNVLTDCRVYAIDGVTAGTAFRTNGASPGHTRIVGSTAVEPRYGLISTAPNVKVDLVSSTILGSAQTAVWAGRGSEVKVQNSILSSSDAGAFFVGPEAGVAKKTVLDVSFSTVVNEGASGIPAIKVSVPNAIAGDAEVNVNSSIIRGFNETWDMTVPAGPGIGKASLAFTHSNFPPVGGPGSGGTVDADAPSNIDEDPLFAGSQDFRLLPASPSIDAGDPASGLTVDFEAAPRPRDGDGNGTSLPDQGAFEFQPSCATVPALCPKDTTAPKLSKVKFRFRFGKGGSVRYRLSEAAVVRLRFTPKGKPKRRTVKQVRVVKAGPRNFRLGKRQLKRGRYTLRLTATDQAGNASKPIVRSVRVR